jgi:hypothetical protein
MNPPGAPVFENHIPASHIVDTQHRERRRLPAQSEFGRNHQHVGVRAVTAAASARRRCSSQGVPLKSSSPDRAASFRSLFSSSRPGSLSAPPANVPAAGPAPPWSSGLVLPAGHGSATASDVVRGAVVAKRDARDLPLPESRSTSASASPEGRWSESGTASGRRPRAGGGWRVGQGPAGGAGHFGCGRRQTRTHGRRRPATDTGTGQRLPHDAPEHPCEQLLPRRPTRPILAIRRQRPGHLMRAGRRGCPGPSLPPPHACDAGLGS